MRAVRERAWRELRDRFYDEYPGEYLAIWHFGRGFAGEANWWELTQEEYPSALSYGTGESGQFYDRHADAAKLSDVYIYRGGQVDELKKYRTIYMDSEHAAAFAQGFEGKKLNDFRFQNLVFNVKSYNDAERESGADIQFGSALAQKFERLVLIAGSAYEDRLVLHRNMKNLKDLRASAQTRLNISNFAGLTQLRRLTLVANVPALRDERAFGDIKRFFSQNKHLRNISLRFEGSYFRQVGLPEVTLDLGRLPELLANFDSLLVAAVYGDSNRIDVRTLLGLSAKFYISSYFRYAGDDRNTGGVALSKIQATVVEALRASNSISTNVTLSRHYSADFSEASAYFNDKLRGFSKQGVDRITVHLRNDVLPYAEASIENEVKENRENGIKDEKGDGLVELTLAEENPGLAGCHPFFAGSKVGRWFWQKFLTPKN